MYKIMYKIAISKIFYFFLKFLFVHFQREGEREEEKHQCVVASCVPPTGNLAHNPGTCPDWEVNQWPFCLQASIQSTEPYSQGTKLPFSGALFSPLRFCFPSIVIGLAQNKLIQILTGLNISYVDRAQRIFKAIKNTLCDFIMMDTCHYTNT